MPAAPTGLALQAGTRNVWVTLTWTDNAVDETGYAVERKDGAGDWQEVAQLGVHTEKYVDSGFAESTTYEYRVKAMNANGGSGYSNTVSFSTGAWDEFLSLGASETLQTATFQAEADRYWDPDTYNPATQAWGIWIDSQVLRVNNSGFDKADVRFDVSSVSGLVTLAKFAPLQNGINAEWEDQLAGILGFPNINVAPAPDGWNEDDALDRSESSPTPYYVQPGINNTERPFKDVTSLVAQDVLQDSTKKVTLRFSDNSNFWYEFTSSEMTQYKPTLELFWILDSDGDTLSDAFENTLDGFDPNNANSFSSTVSDREAHFGGLTEAQDDIDTDNDTIGSFREVIIYNTKPNKSDSDDDGLPDDFELRFNLNPNDNTDTELDSDGDSLSNNFEGSTGTSPTQSDTDRDGKNDKDEYDQESDPTDPSDEGQAPEVPEGSTYLVVNTAADGSRDTFDFTLTGPPFVGTTEQQSPEQHTFTLKRGTSEETYTLVYNPREAINPKDNSVSLSASFSPGPGVSVTPSGGLSGGSSTQQWTVTVQPEVAEEEDPKDDCEDSNSDCDTCTGGATADLGGSLRYRIDLGFTDYGEDAGYLEIHAHQANKKLATPAELDVYAASGVTVELNPAGELVSAASANLTVRTIEIDKYSYRLDISSPDGNVFKTITVENPDGATAFNRLQITEAGEANRVSLYDWDGQNETWSLSEGPTLANILRTETRSSVDGAAANTRVDTTTIKNGDGTVVSKTVETYKNHSWGEALIERVLDPDGAALTTTWEYYDDAGNPASYGKWKLVVDQDGYWEKFNYDSQDRLTSKVVQLDQNDTASADSANLQYVYSYSTVTDLADDSDSTDEELVTITEMLGVTEKARRYELTLSGTVTFDGDTCNETRDIVADAPGVAWNNASNTRTTRTLTLASGTNEGETRAIFAPMDYATLYGYSTANDPEFGPLEIQTVDRGFLNSGGTAIDSGSRTVTERTEAGDAVMLVTYPIDGGSVLTAQPTESSVVPSSAYLDSFGRITRWNHLDGTTTQRTYGCCGVESETNRRGVTTDYLYDALRRRTHRIDAAGTVGETTTIYTYDGAGRVTKVEGPNGSGNTITLSESVYDLAGRLIRREDAENRWTFYTYGTESVTGNSYHETRVYPDGNTAGPVQVTWSDDAGRTIRSFLASTTGSWTSSSPPTGSESLTELTRSAYAYDWRGRTTTIREYHDLTGLSMSADGTVGTNYYESETLEYSAFNRPTLVSDVMGDLTETAYDALDRPTEIKRGTTTGNLVTVSQNYYDTNRDGTGDLRDYVTRSTFVRPTATLSYANIDYEHDAAGRRTWTKPPAGPWTQTVYDAAGRVSETITARNGNQTFILAKTTNAYDPNTGQLTSARVHEVNGSGSTTANYQETAYTYDAAGRRSTITRPQDGYVEVQYDGTNQFKRVLLRSDLSPSAVLQEAVLSYDDVGNVVELATYERRHDASGTGLLSSNTSAARVTTLTAWYDAAHRTTHVVDFGTGTPTGTAPEPNTSDNYLVTKAVYNASGRPFEVIDNAGTVTRREYDALGRITRSKTTSTAFPGTTTIASPNTPTPQTARPPL